MKEETNLRTKFGTREPFNVPDGYFEQFTARMMDKLPEKKPNMLDLQVPTRWQRIRPMLYLAAMFCILLTCGKLVLTYTADEKTKTAKTEEVNSKTEENAYLDEMINYAMIDEAVIYNYMNESE